MENGTSFHSNKFVNNHKAGEVILQSYTEDMTQDLSSLEDKNDNTTVADFDVGSNAKSKEGTSEKLHESSNSTHQPNKKSESLILTKLYIVIIISFRY